MNETIKTQPAYQAETLLEVSLRNRTSTADLWPEVFGSLRQRSVISVAGSSGSGKSMFVMEAIAKALVIENLEVLVLDADRHFNIFILSSILLKYTDEDNIKSCLKKLKIFTCNEMDFDNIFSKLPLTLQDSKHQKVSLIVIDSLGLFYYARGTDSDEKIVSKEAYITSYLHSLKSLTQRYNVTAIYTTLGCMRFPPSGLQELSTLVVNLVQHDEGSFSMTTKDKAVNFTIDASGIKLIESQSD